MAVRELLRLSDGFGKGSLCLSDISRVQLKSNGAVGERLVASDQEVVIEWRLNLDKRK